VTHERPELDDFTAEAHKLLKTTDAITRLSTSDKEIIRTCIKCEEVASSLQQALSKLKDTSRLKTSVWNSFTEALKTVWGDEKLQGVKQQLENYRQQMTSLLLVSVRLVGSSPPNL
jgi:hypothetical protein